MGCGGVRLTLGRQFIKRAAGSVNKVIMCAGWKATQFIEIGAEPRRVHNSHVARLCLRLEWLGA
jgi:hypothetical protein